MHSNASRRACRAGTLRRVLFLKIADRHSCEACDVGGMGVYCLAVEVGNAELAMQSPDFATFLQLVCNLYSYRHSCHLNII